MTEEIRSKRVGRVAVVTLNRPERLNALDQNHDACTPGRTRHVRVG